MELIPVVSGAVLAATVGRAGGSRFITSPAQHSSAAAATLIASFRLGSLAVRINTAHSPSTSSILVQFMYQRTGIFMAGECFCGREWVLIEIFSLPW